MRAQYEFTPDDMTEHQRAIQRRHLGMVWPFIILPAVIAGVFYFVAATAISSPTTPPPAGTGATASDDLADLLEQLLPWLVGILGAFVGIVLIRRRIGPRRALEKTPALHGSMSADINAMRVVIEARLYRAEYQWPAFTRFAETKNLFLLFVSPNSAVILPKRAFANDEERQALRNMAQTLPRKQTGGFPVEPPAPIASVQDEIALPEQVTKN